MDVGHGPVLVGGAVLLVMVGVALLAPWIAPADPRALAEPMLPSSPAHPLGTNDVGQDLLSELLYGARFSLLIGFLSATVSAVVGLGLGLVAGYYDRAGFLIMRVVDVFMAVPRFPLIILMAAFLRPGPGTLVLFFILFGWPRLTRLVRAQILSERSKGYVEASRLTGARDLRLLGVHLLPAALPIVSVHFVMEFQHVVLAESGLSFLGLGDPTIKSWGMMLSYASRYPTIFISDVWVRWALPPGLCITLTVLALTLVGFALERWAHPQLRTGVAR
jgi:ABC-type dipeptide/oligopeptide/nickel transport system permease subunit